MSQKKRPSGVRPVGRPSAPWQPIIDDGQETQPQGLIDFVPATNVTVDCDLSIWRLLAIQTGNVVFSLATLGVYRFWGRTRLRRAVWESVEVAGSRLIYTGTGIELFIATLLAVSVLLLPIAALGLGLLIAPVGSPIFWPMLAIAFLAFASMHFMGTYFRARYWGSRTLWRGICGQLGGSALTYTLIGLGQLALVVITLGLWWPRMQMHLMGYVVGNFSLGALKPAWHENRAGLLSAWVLVWGFGLLALVGWISWFGVSSGFTPQGFASVFGQIFFFGTAIISTLCCLIALWAYDVAIVRARVSSISLIDLNIFSRVTFTQVLRLNVVLFGCRAVIVGLIGIIGLLSFSAWAPWLSEFTMSVRSIVVVLPVFGTFLAELPWMKTVLIMGLWLWTTTIIASALLPLVRVVIWLHIHKQTLTFEGHFDFAESHQVKPGQFRSLGEGLSLALDAGGL